MPTGRSTSILWDGGRERRRFDSVTCEEVVKASQAQSRRMCVGVEFTHQGLATTTLVLTVLTTITGFVLLGTRYGYPPRKGGQAVVRWAHIVLGVCMAVYLVATYYIVPV